MLLIRLKKEKRDSTEHFLFSFFQEFRPNFRGNWFLKQESGKFEQRKEKKKKKIIESSGNIDFSVDIRKIRLEGTRES